MLSSDFDGDELCGTATHDESDTVILNAFVRIMSRESKVVGDVEIEGDDIIPDGLYVMCHMPSVSITGNPYVGEGIYYREGNYFLIDSKIAGNRDDLIERLSKEFAAKASLHILR